MSLGRVLILGAGPCGLGAAQRLVERGHRDVAVFDRAGAVGGLATSETDAHGFTWDLGGHVLFSRIAHFNQAMDRLPLAWITQPRDAQIWIAGRLVPFPLQYNLHRLPPDMARECLAGLETAPGFGAGTANFADWMEAGFGPGLTRIFMRPYNEKVWAGPAARMSVNWVGERVAAPDYARALSNFEAGRDDAGWGPNATFRYPVGGGTGAIWRALAAPLRNVTLGREAIAIDAKARRVSFADGGSEPYDRLVSTLPLPALVAMAKLDHLAAAAANLESTIVHAVGIGIAGQPADALRARRWIYFPESEYPFYRVSVLSNYAPDIAPAGHWSLLTETAESPHRPLDRATLVARVEQALRHAGLLAADDRVVSRWHRVIAPGYPVPTLGRDAALATLLPALDALGIHSRGRFGAWCYEISNQDHSFMQGVELADRLLHGGGEPLLTTRAP